MAASSIPGSQAGYPNDPSWYWIATYTVEVDKGKFPMIDGKERTFYLYLGYDGMYKYGDVRAIRPLAQRLESPTSNLGTQTWSENGLYFTVTNKVAKLTSDEVSKLGKTSFAR